MWNSISNKIIEFLNSITIEDVINEYKNKQKLQQKTAGKPSVKSGKLNAKTKNCPSN